MKQRYKTANEIRDAIDRYRLKARKLRDSAQALDIKAREFALAGPEYKSDVEWNHLQAEKKRKSAQRIEERQLTKLKHKLSEFMTPVMKGMPNDDDRSIPVR